MELLPNIPTGSVDLVLCDLPYGVTECAWDIALPLDVLWKEYRRVLRPCGTAVLFGVQPFTTQLINSNPAGFRYLWYWKKNNKTGAPFAKMQPMRCIEEIAVFYTSTSQDNSGKYKELRRYMREQLAASGMSRADVGELLGNSMASHYFTDGKQFAIPNAKSWAKLQSTGYFQRSHKELREEWEKEAGGKAGHGHTYNPQGLVELERPKHNRPRKSGVYSGGRQCSVQKHTGYPHHLLEFDNEALNKDRLHPTQKPVPLLEYLVRTYTNEGETVLDNCMGSGSTGVACVRAGRRFIGMEKDAHFYRVAVDRIEQEAQSAATKSCTE